MGEIEAILRNAERLVSDRLRPPTTISAVIMDFEATTESAQNDNGLPERP
jgi:hypothetical protein